MKSNLQTRIVTATLLGGTLVAVVLLLPPPATLGMLSVLVLIGAWEWSALLRLSNLYLRAGYVALIGASLYLSWRFAMEPSTLHAVMTVAVTWWIAALAWVVLAPRRVSPWAAALAGILALAPAWLALSHLRLASPRGAQWVLFVFVLVWMADIGGYVFGRRFGRVRLAPQVSPGKTWEGVFGGFILSSLVAFAGSAWFDISIARFVPLCLGVVAFSIVGDLTESLLKRFAGVKDSGTLFPGHGGMMDRIDSITAAAPVLLFGLLALGVVP